MKKITLKPLDDGQKSVEIPLGKTTIGRGPFLGCGDKKVSRNHAILEVTDKGEVFLTPTHVNPCFFQPTSESPGTILKKDKPHKLENGDSFSLLPRAFRYMLLVANDVNDAKSENDKDRNEVIGEEKVNGTTEDKSEESSTSEAKVPDVESDKDKASDTSKLQNDKVQKEPVPSSKEDTASEKEETKQCDLKNGYKVSDSELNESDSQELPKTKEESLVKKDEPAINKEDKEKQSTSVKNVDDEEKDEEDDGDEVVKKQDEEEEEETKKDEENETSSRNKRCLPTWIVDIADEKEGLKKPEKNTKVHRGKATAKRKTETAVTPEKRTKKRMERRRDSGDDQVAVHHPQRSSTGRSPRTNRQTRQGISLEDFIASDDDEWQSDQSQPTRKKKRRAAKRKDDDSGSDWEIEHKKSKKVSHKFSSGSESDWGTHKKKRTPKMKRRRSKRTKDPDPDIISDEEEEDDKSTSEKPEKRVACQYGKKCFRKRQSHLDQYSHPGDSDYESEAEVEKEDADPVGDDDDDNVAGEDASEGEANSTAKECPYGASCYRKNAQHRKDFKHTKKVRPQREAAKQAGKKAKTSKENDEPDAYDLNDSFINDDSDDYNPVDSGSEFDSSQESQELRSPSPKGSKRVAKTKRAKRV